MSMFATRIAKTATAAVITVGALGMAHSFTAAKPAESQNFSAAGPVAGATVPSTPSGASKLAATDDVTWGH
ncbi:hypothetical protein ABTZ03_40375 [Kitasatospora sp. NPDC096077]|uniref:hypothetical protein n=1 Tax=Kitasatospora sp. NPDC096077 TaxID=3155544 RepID=UPI0033320A1D